MGFLEIEPEGSLALRAQRLAQDLGGDEGVAVAIAADPAADPQERGHLEPLPSRIDRAELVFEIGVEARQFTQERVVVIGEAVRHLVEHPEARPAQDAGLPQGEDRPAQRLAVGGQLLRGELHAIALVEQLGDLHFAIDRALPADFRRMGRQDRAAQGGAEEFLQGRR